MRILSEIWGKKKPLIFLVLWHQNVMYQQKIY